MMFVLPMLFGDLKRVRSALLERLGGARGFSLRIPESKIDAWGGAINVMYSQLIRYLERRPDRHSHEGKEMTQILLLMDEFARFGKLERLFPLPWLLCGAKA